MKTLLDALGAELERPREMSAQVEKHLAANYEVAGDSVAEFLNTRLGALEDYEIDLILSPLFTPTIHDQAVFAGLLGAESIGAEKQDELIGQLVARPVEACIVVGRNQQCRVPLREVTIERYVRRLRLGGTITDSVLRLITHLPPAADRPTLMAVARRAVWENESRALILTRFLTATAGEDDYQLDDVVALMKLVETYQPPDVADLLSRIPHWRQVLRHEIGLASSPKHFFNERIQEMHGGGRDRRSTDNALISGKQRELEFLDRLEVALTRD